MLTVSVSRVYSSPMPLFVYVHPKGATVPVRLRADTVEQVEGTTRLIVKKGQDKIGEFFEDLIAGWWIQEED